MGFVLFPLSCVQPAADFCIQHFFLICVVYYIFLSFTFLQWVRVRSVVLWFACVVVHCT